MDVCGLFIGDTSLSYGTIRNPVYRDYEKYPYGTLENLHNPMKDYYSKMQEKCQQKRDDKKEKKETCPFCKEQKKRPLVSYLRRRELQKNHDKICEEECPEDSLEEHDEEHESEEFTTTDEEECEANAVNNTTEKKQEYCKNATKQNENSLKDENK